MAGQSIGVSAGGDTERIARASQFSRQTDMANKGGPVNKPSTMGASAAVITGSPRGILKQTNIGDVQSSVDNVARETQKSAAAVKKQVDQAAQKFSQQLTDKGAAVAKRT